MNTAQREQADLIRSVINQGLAVYFRNYSGTDSVNTAFLVGAALALKLIADLMPAQCALNLAGENLALDALRVRTNAT